MKKVFINILLVLSILAGFSATASAQDCPSGTHRVYNAKTNEVLCFSLASETERYVSKSEAASEDEDNLDEQIYQSLQTNGVELGMGLGYGMIGALDIRVAAGYYFNIPKANGLGFSLNTDFNIRFPYPGTLDWSVLPMFHVYSHSFRVGFGLGLGIFHEFDNDDYDYDYDYYYYDDYYENYTNHKRKKTFFMVKPEVRMDWFLNENISLGLVLDIPLILGGYDEIDSAKPNIQPWFSMTLSLGYKF